MDKKELLTYAKEARERAYCPYSEISVGAALLTKSGRIYLGANIENSAFSPSICAERAALTQAVLAGERDFSAIAVVGGRRGRDASQLFPPCGVCRQAMSEFCAEDFEIILERDGEPITKALGELFPFGFGKEHEAFL